MRIIRDIYEYEDIEPRNPRLHYCRDIFVGYHTLVNLFGYPFVSHSPEFYEWEFVFYRKRLKGFLNYEKMDSSYLSVVLNRRWTLTVVGNDKYIFPMWRLMRKYIYETRDDSGI